MATGSIVITPSQKLQTILGFGGAFTDSASFNFHNLSPKDQVRSEFFSPKKHIFSCIFSIHFQTQDKVISLYFGDGGIGYTFGRLPINSCDFSLYSYNFDNVSGDFDLKYFDNDVKHDTYMMIPFIKRAMEGSIVYDTFSLVYSLKCIE